MELWLLFSIIAVALILIVLIKGRKDEKFTRRKAAAILVAAPILFVLSGFFLANTLLNPVESIQYQLGKALCFVVSPTLLLSGIAVYLASPHVNKKKPVSLLPEWEQRMRKIYGIAALLAIGLLVLSQSPLMLFGLVLLIPYIVFFIYLLKEKRNLIVSLFFLVLWYLWFPGVSNSLSPIHFSQVFTEAIKNPPYFGPLGYNVYWLFYSVMMFPGVIMLLFSSLSGIKSIEKIMAKVFTAKTCAAILIVPLILMFALPPQLVTNPNLHHPSVVAGQAVEISINGDRTERYFNEASGEWTYSIAVSYNGRLILENVSLGGVVVSQPFDNNTVMVTENNDDVSPNFPNSGLVVIRDKAFVTWVSLVSRNSLGEAIYSVGWF